MQPILHDPVFALAAQFGYRKGKSTENALSYMRRVVSKNTNKYVLGIFYDATAAFDNLWWPAVFGELKRRDCPANLIYLIVTSLLGRLRFGARLAQ